MSLSHLLSYLLKTPSRWGQGVKLAWGKVTRSQEVVIAADGVRLVCGLGSGEGVWCALRGLDYEPELRMLLRLLHPGNVFLDIGANIGAYSIRASRCVGASGKVFAFEPLDRTKRRLEQALLLNQAKNVTVVPKAVGQQSGQIQLAIAGRGSSASITPQKHATEHHQVPMVSIDDFVAQTDLFRVDWIKMDIEGAEPLALAGMGHSIDRFRPGFLFENEGGGAKTAAILRSKKYKIGSFGKHGEFFETESGANLFALPAEKPTPSLRLAPGPAQ